MARPIKNNADYFSHDNDMRNDEKILAVRNEFDLEGYAIWCMLLEKLCKANFFEIEYNDKTITLIAGDFRVSFQRLKQIIDYFIEIDLLQKNNDNIFSEELKHRFTGLLAKRNRDNTNFRKRKQSEKEVFAIENTQSKVKERKVKERKVKESKDNNNPLTPFKGGYVFKETPHQKIINCYLETKNKIPFANLPSQTVKSGYRRFGKAAKNLLKDTDDDVDLILNAIRYLPLWSQVKGLEWSLETVSKAIAEPQSFKIDIPQITENERKLIKTYLYLKGWEEEKVKNLDLQNSKHTKNLIIVSKEILHIFNNDLEKTLKALEKYKSTLKEKQELNLYFFSKWAFENNGG